MQNIRFFLLLCRLRAKFNYLRRNASSFLSSPAEDMPALTEGECFRYLKEQWAALFQAGYYDGLLFWLTFWLIIICALFSGWDMVRSVIQVQTESQTLKLKNEMAVENYRLLLAKIKEQNQQSAQVRFTQHFAVNAMLQSAAERAEKAGIRFEAHGFGMALKEWKHNANSAEAYTPALLFYLLF